MSSANSERITEGSLLKALVSLSFPLFLQNLIQVGQLLIDLFWLGRYSADAVAALGLLYPLMGLLFTFVTAVPFIGTQVLVSQRVGADDDEGANRATASGVTLAVVFGLTAAVVVPLSADSMVTLITAIQPQETAAATVGQLAATYFTIIALGIVVSSTGDVLEASFVARGDSRAALYLSVVTVGANVVFDPLLIFGYGPFPPLGMSGAALATVSGYVAALILALAFNAVGRSGGVVSTDGFRLDFDEYRELVEIGYPKASESLARRSARLFVVSLMFAVGGTVGLGAYIIGSRVSSVASIPAKGFQSATQSIVGQNLGSNQPGRANRTTWLGVGLSMSVLGVFALIQWTVPGMLVNSLAPEAEGELFALAVKFLRITALGYPALGAVYIFQGGFNGARRTKVSFVSSLMQYWLVQVPVALAAKLWLDAGIELIFWGITGSNVIAAVGLGAYYLFLSNRGFHEDAVEAASSTSD